MDTVDGIWQQYCRMQDVLLNIMSAKELFAVLGYARGNRKCHPDCRY